MMEDASPRYWQLQQEIKGIILRERLSTGDKIPSERELSKLYKISQGTVQKAILNLVNEGVLEKRHGSGTYVKSSGALYDGLVSSQASIGLVLPDLAFFPDLIASAERQCSASGYSLVVKCSGRDNALEARVFDGLLANDKVRGLLIVPNDLPPDLSNFESLKSRNVPFVVLDRMVDGLEADFIAQDNVAGMRLGVSHLAASGRKRIAFMGITHKWMYHFKERLKGYKAALSEAGIPFDESLIFCCRDGEDVINGTEMFERFKAFIEKSPVDAVACYTDTSALRLCKSLAEWGVKVPDAVAVLGYDNMDMAEFASIPLSSVAPLKSEIGALGVKRLLERISGDLSFRVESLPATLRLRKSC